MVALKPIQALRIAKFGKIAENGGAGINVWIVLDVIFLVHRRPYSRRTAVVSSFASRRPSIYLLASARTSLVGAKSSRRSVARASRPYFSRCARPAASEPLGEAVLMLTQIPPHHSILLHPTL